MRRPTFAPPAHVSVSYGGQAHISPGLRASFVWQATDAQELMAKSTLCLIGLCVTVAVTRAQPPQSPELRSFYVATYAGFGIWTDQIVSVESVGGDVRVRVMRFQSVNDACPEVRVVQAAERVIPKATVQAVARVPLCEVSQRTIDRAHARSKTPGVHYVDYMGASQTVVADCEGHQRVLQLRDTAPWLNFETLRRVAPAISALWDVRDRLSAGMLPMTSQVPSPAAESLGTSLVAELRSPKYAAAFGDALATALEDYNGAPRQREPVPRVLERERLPFATFVAPRYPPIALAARVSGDVRLRLSVNAAGVVTQVERVADKPLIGDAAAQAARAWTFDPARSPGEPVDVTVRFTLTCGEG